MEDKLDKPFMETLITPDFDTKFNKQELLEKFSKVLDRAEEIAQWEEFKAYKEQVSKAHDMLDIDHYMDYIKPYIDRITAKLEFGNRSDTTACMIALAGNNWL